MKFIGVATVALERRQSFGRSLAPFIVLTLRRPAAGVWSLAAFHCQLVCVVGRNGYALTYRLPW